MKGADVYAGNRHGASPCSSGRHLLSLLIKMEIHLIANAHLDPVWLWDWREGLNEGHTTVKTVLDIMDDVPELKFIRGEAVIYEHIEQNDPALFRRIQKMVENGRWDVVGGTYLQADTNLAGIETLARQFTRGQRYFESRFGQRPKAAWQADSFGHTAGLPEILAAAGIESFAFTRPDPKTMPLPEPAFWWEGQGGARVLAYRPLAGWYGAERDEMPQRLDALVEAARNSSLETVGCFYGLGNHGGGPSRKQVQEIQRWAKAHPEIKVVFSGLHNFFEALRSEIANKPALQVIRGELNFCLRGCYSSAARIKFLYRQSEALVNRAERADSLLAAKTGRAPAKLAETWDGLLFNSFHDILPGSSIERVLEDQARWLGGVLHSAKRAEFRALNELASLVDTTVAPAAPDHPTGVAAVVWNPHPHAFKGHIEMEACIDYRPIHSYKDRPSELPLRILGSAGSAMSFQKIEVESKMMPHLPWRQRVVMPVSIPAFGWNVLELAWVEGAQPPKTENPVQVGENWIGNGIYKVEAQLGSEEVHFSYKGRPVFVAKGLSAQVMEDPWGSWGGTTEEPESLLINTLREKWTITGMKVLESGPERAKLWVRFSGKKSRLDLFFSLCREREAVDVDARLLWDERCARLKLAFPARGEAEFEVPGAAISRAEQGEVPGGRWVRVHSENGGFGFASDSLYNFSRENGELQATVVRATRYAYEHPAALDEEPWRPVLDTGELTFRFLMTHAGADLPRLSQELETPVVVSLATPSAGPLPKEGSLAELYPASLQLLALKSAENGDGFILRVQAPAGSRPEAHLLWMGQKITLGAVPGGKIVSWHLKKLSDQWTCKPVDLVEEPVGKQVHVAASGNGALSKRKVVAREKDLLKA